MNSFYFYTETAFHHQGDFDYIKKLILASKEAGAHAVKFQVLTNVTDFISTKHTSFEALSNWCFNYSEWCDIFSFTKDQGLDIVLMPLNVDALTLVNQFPVKFLEIHSVSFYDTQLHEKIRQTGIDLIIGMGGRTIVEAEKMRLYFGAQLKILMTGFQSFPSKLEDVKLGKIAWLKKHFPQLTLGYADHSGFDDEFAVISNDYAYLLGARVFEKHITINEGEERVDFSAAVSAEKIKQSIGRLQFLSKNVVLTDADYSVFNEPELKYRNRQLVCVADKNIKMGDTVLHGDIRLKLIDTTEKTFSEKEAVAGKTAICDIDFDTAIFHSQII